MTTRVVLVAVVALAARLGLAVVLGWLAHRPHPRWMYVAALVNLVLAACVLYVIVEFRRHGLTLAGVLSTAIVVLFASSLARMGTIAMRVITGDAAPR